MKNKKGFTLIELMICLAIIGFVIPIIFNFFEEEKIAQKAGSLVQEFKQELDQKIENHNVEVITTYEKAKIVNTNGPTSGYAECFEGKKVVHIKGEMYHIGKMDSWGDIKSIDCKAGE